MDQELKAYLEGKLEADQSNLDVSLRSRVDVLENRLLQIELRLGLQ
jgi:hypothetical protein